MSTYNISFDSTTSVLSVGFGDPGTNCQIVKDALSQINAIDGLNGKLCLVNGAASMPCAFVIAHKVAHLFSAVGVFDPKLQGYVICISHSPDYAVGDFIPKA